MKRILALFCFVVLSFSLFANSDNFSITTDFAYYPKSEPVAKEGSDVNRFAPLSGVYSGLEFRVVGKYNYIIPTPFGSNPLVKGNNLNLSCAFELTPVSIAPQFSVSFTPIAFLNFSASAKFATGWEFIGIKGMGEYVSNQDGYKNLTPFKNYFYEYKFSSLFQFDLGAIVPGDWTHVVTMATYDVIYKGLTGIDTSKPWIWQGTGEGFNGWNYNSTVVLGYQMPLILQTVGLQFEFSGYYSDSNIDKSFKKWNPTFMKIAINPICILKFNEKHALTIQLGFSSRRGFSSEKSSDDKTNFALDYNGREWFFNRIAFSYAVKL